MCVCVRYNKYVHVRERLFCVHVPIVSITACACMCVCMALSTIFMCVSTL